MVNKWLYWDHDKSERSLDERLLKSNTYIP